jgi:hypothetical protein
LRLRPLCHAQKDIGMNNDYGNVSRLLTKWVMYKSTDSGVYLHIQSWRWIGQVRKIQILSMKGGAHEVYAKDIKGKGGAERLAEVMSYHV